MTSLLKVNKICEESPLCFPFGAEQVEISAYSTRLIKIQFFSLLQYVRNVSIKEEGCLHLVLENVEWTQMSSSCTFLKSEKKIIIIFFFIYYTDFNINLLFTSTYRIESKYEVTILGGLNEFAVKFYGPRGSRSFWFLSVELFIT